MPATHIAAPSREDLRQTSTLLSQIIGVLEEGTGSESETSWGGSLEEEPFTAMVGLSYSGEISVAQHDGTPVPDEPLSLCVSLYGDIRKLRDVLSYYYGLDEEELFDRVWSVRT